MGIQGLPCPPPPVSYININIGKIMDKYIIFQTNVCFTIKNYIWHILLSACAISVCNSFCNRCSISYYCCIPFSLIVFQGMMVVQSIISEAVVTPHLWSLGESIRIIWVCPLMTRMKTQHGLLAQPLQKSTHIQFVSGFKWTKNPVSISRSHKSWMCSWLIFDSNLQVSQSVHSANSQKPLGPHRSSTASQLFWTCNHADPCRFQHEFLILKDVSSQLWIAKTCPYS